MLVEDLVVRRKAAKLPQQAVAALLGWTQGKLSNIETEPSLDVTGRLADRWLDAIEVAANGAPTA
jgi:transcriptional regulator with XRE-family HTH domain